MKGREQAEAAEGKNLSPRRPRPPRRGPGGPRASGRVFQDQIRAQGGPSAGGRRSGKKPSNSPKNLVLDGSSRNCGGAWAKGDARKAPVLDIFGRDRYAKLLFGAKFDSTSSGPLYEAYALIAVDVLVVRPPLARAQAAYTKRLIISPTGRGRLQKHRAFLAYMNAASRSPRRAPERGDRLMIVVAASRTGTSRPTGATEGVPGELASCPGRGSSVCGSRFTPRTHAPSRASPKTSRRGALPSGSPRRWRSFRAWTVTADVGSGRPRPDWMAALLAEPWT